MGMEFCAAPCQERFMNHVMCFAAEYLQNVKIVCLTGAIKTCVKTKWEDLLNNNVYRNIKPKIDEWKEEIRNLPVHELPPRCFCPETCSHSLGNLDVDDSGPDRPMIFEGMAWDYHGFRIPYEQ
ncbi:unnamed protein product [Zymoseptoria tritici ST99CH_3D7]|uniref:Uncharacterized protein n=1 Tax=Zymoseptoria tritici (strain ST99CH_3D7) TaxID=1276538 RepID=A0A1X7S0A3_ZYMT9|nr:unnamed protein product [Zymoseptoria tritici ST99CH_3D7]